MPIQKLAEATVRVLGATQTLTDSTSVVKELLDNALDANATSVSVEISSNTLDIIQVRDTGHGIPPEDRLAVARPHCTSKITHDDDLKSIGGSSLGFRGEALASIAEVSGSLTITTRIEEETVAAVLKINGLGEVVARDRASHPVGTTVRITDFIQGVAVRRQHALKNADSSLKKIKQLMQAYAFARPHMRLSLRVLKAKNDKGNWTYAPRAGGSLDDAACKIVGAACASQCVSLTVEARGFVMRALLPRLDADIRKISGVGAYMSVDARPVNVNRGIFKQIGKLFRDGLRLANVAADGVRDPFLYLDVSCPTASYDANVEPAKDDLLFENPDDVLETARRLFAAAYPCAEKRVPTTAQMLPAHTGLADEAVTEESRPLTSFGTSRNRDQGIQYSGMKQDDVIAETSSHDQEGDIPSTQIMSSMYDHEDIGPHTSEIPSRTQQDDDEVEELRRCGKDITLSNPWVFAALNTTSRQLPKSQGASSSPRPTASLLRSSGSSPLKQIGRLDLEHVPYLPTPQPSSPYPLVPGFRPTSFDHYDGHNTDNLLSDSSPSRVRAPLLSPTQRNAELDLEQHHEQGQALGQDGHLHSASKTPLDAIPEKPARPHRSAQKTSGAKAMNLPYKMPLKDLHHKEKAWFDHLENIGRRPQAYKRQPQSPTGTNLVIHGDRQNTPYSVHALTPPRRNRDIREFVQNVDMTGDEPVASMIERRNLIQQGQHVDEDAGHHYDERFLRNNEDERRSDESLHTFDFISASKVRNVEEAPVDEPPRKAKRRRTSERQALQEVSGNGALYEQGEENDEQTLVIPRSTSRRRRKNSRKLTRTKSSRLPLESTPVGQGSHDLVHKVVISCRGITESVARIDEKLSLQGYRETELGGLDAFDTLIDNADDIEHFVSRLNDLLVAKAYSDLTIQELLALVQQALAARQVTVLDEHAVDEDIEMLI